MISREEVYRIGTIGKPHGVKGEVTMAFTDDIFDRADCGYIVVLTEGIMVPFFIEECRFRSDTSALMKLEGIDTADEARRLTNAEVYFPKKYAGDDDEAPLTWEWFVGFRVEDVRLGHLGEVVAVDDSTINVLFVIEGDDGREILVPAHEEFVVGVDKRRRVLTVKTPDGLIEV